MSFQSTKALRELTDGGNNGRLKNRQHVSGSSFCWAPKWIYAYLSEIFGRLGWLRCIGSAQRGVPLKLRTDSIDGDHVGMTVGRKVRKWAYMWKEMGEGQTEG
jgi:hypothetical protein